MAPVADRAAMEAHLLQQEIVRLDTMAKQKIDSIMLANFSRIYFFGSILVRGGHRIKNYATN